MRSEKMSVDAEAGTEGMAEQSAGAPIAARGGACGPRVAENLVRLDLFDMHVAEHGIEQGCAMLASGFKDLQDRGNIAGGKARNGPDAHCFGQQMHDLASLLKVCADSA